MYICAYYLWNIWKNLLKKRNIIVFFEISFSENQQIHPNAVCVYFAFKCASVIDMFHQKVAAPFIRSFCRLSPLFQMYMSLTNIRHSNAHVLEIGPPTMKTSYIEIFRTLVNS